MKKPTITEKQVTAEFDTRFMKVYDMQYYEGKHYYNASRRTRDNLVVLMDDEAYHNMIADAVSCVVIVDAPGEEPRLLLSWEFRYPVNHYVLGVPAGLIDASDRETPDPVKSAAIREIAEETGMVITAEDVTPVNPALLSSPGMTDESNAIVCVRVRPENLAQLSRAGAEENELFGNFELLTYEDARKLMADGRDSYGNVYSVYTWVALAWFLLGENR